MPSASYKIIVARYNENVEWLRSEAENCIFYNKGDSLQIMNEVMVKNVGREAETYLRYIVTNYDTLPDVVVFTQARIADHKGSDDIGYLLKIKNEAAEHGKSQNFHVHYDVGNDHCWDKNWNDRGASYYLHDNYKDNNRILFIDWFLKHIDTSYPDPISIYISAIFAVKKELILRNPVEYYERLMLEVNHHTTPAEAHFLERSWFHMFKM